MQGNLIAIVILSSLISLIGTMIGASLGILIKKPSNKVLSNVIGFAGGLMLAVIVFDLIPEAVERVNLMGTVAFSFIGMTCIIILDNTFGNNNFCKDKHLKVALMTALGLMLHNLPEGIVMGCGFLAGGTLGLKMSVIIAIHDIPEGIAISAPMMASRIKPIRIMLYALITASPTAVGAVIGITTAGVSKNSLGACLAFASGIMLYVVCGEMIPESSKLWNGIAGTVGVLSGFLLGFILTQLL
ncbi:MAG: ZIP family metal transporter [Bacillota bacterium]|nr:ZIP family metal transporter [Bacillota bacterium]